ncbi:uncharacterized protein VTP21DRAFT_4759 [Calcarisporiella thermophila]|uniref:uncharacterized protein n=1 Tax=Calcarisporiella thermophila TaxID=911321 RepID=UPI00374475F9
MFFYTLAPLFYCLVVLASVCKHLVHCQQECVTSTYDWGEYVYCQQTPVLNDEKPAQSVSTSLSRICRIILSQLSPIYGKLKEIARRIRLVPAGPIIAKKQVLSR